LFAAPIQAAEKTGFENLTLVECQKVEEFLESEKFFFEKYANALSSSKSTGDLWIVELIGIQIAIPVDTYTEYQFAKGDNSIRLILRGDVSLAVLIGPNTSDDSTDLGQLFDVTPENLRCDDSSLYEDSRALQALQRKLMAKPPGYNPGSPVRIVRLTGESRSGFSIHGVGKQPESFVWFSEFTDHESHVMWEFKYDTSAAVDPRIDARFEIPSPTELHEPPWWAELSSRIVSAKNNAPENPYIGTLPQVE
jgi:hypothetical protein